MLALPIVNESNYPEGSISIEFRQVNDCLPSRTKYFPVGSPLPIFNEKIQGRVKHCLGSA